MKTYLVGLIALLVVSSSFAGTIRVKNNGMYPASVRVSSHEDGTLLPSTPVESDHTVTVTIDPGVTWTAAWGIATVSNAYVEYGSAWVKVETGDTPTGPEALVGNSYVAPSPPTETEWTEAAYTTYGAEEDIMFYHQINEVVTREPTPDSAKTLWLVPDTELTADLFREGIDKVVAAQNSAGEGGESGGMTAEDFNMTATEAVAQAQMSMLSDMPDHEDVADTRDAARTAAEESVTQTAPTLGTVSVPTSSSLLAFTVPYVGAVNLDPADNTLIATFCAYVKLITGWGLLTYFCWWAWGEFALVLRASVTAQQAHGNPVVGGTGAQATSLVAAAILTVIFVGIPATYWAFVSVDFSSLSSNPFNTSHGTIVTTGLYLLGLVFPYDVALTLLASAFVIKRAGTVMVLGINAAIKYVVP